MEADAKLVARATESLLSVALCERPGACRREESDFDPVRHIVCKTCLRERGNGIVSPIPRGECRCPPGRAGPLQIAATGIRVGFSVALWMVHGQRVGFRRTSPCRPACARRSLQKMQSVQKVPTVRIDQRGQRMDIELDPVNLVPGDIVFLEARSCASRSAPWHRLCVAAAGDRRRVNTPGRSHDESLGASGPRRGRGFGGRGHRGALVGCLFVKPRTCVSIGASGSGCFQPCFAEAFMCVVTPD